MAAATARMSSKRKKHNPGKWSQCQRAHLYWLRLDARVSKHSGQARGLNLYTYPTPLHSQQASSVVITTKRTPQLHILRGHHRGGASLACACCSVRLNLNGKKSLAGAHHDRGHQRRQVKIWATGYTRSVVCLRAPRYIGANLCC